MPTTTQTITDGDKTVTIGSDGSVNVHRKHHDSFDGGSFFAGIMVALLVMWLTRFRGRRGRAEQARAAAAAETARSGQRDFEREYHELAKRTAILERIVTDPSVRVHNEIEALR
jgi:hypothetical protein